MLRFSKNVMSQALKRVKPDIEKLELFRLINVPDTMCTNMRYWRECYNAKPWRNRPLAERTAARAEAKRILGLPL